MSTWKFYADAGLTVLATGGVAVVSSETHTDRRLWFGSPAIGKVAQAAPEPGTTPIEIIPADVAAGSGIEASAIRLSLSAAGLGSATPGAALTVGTTLTGGPGGAVIVYVRTSRGALGIGNYADLSLVTTPLVES